MKVLFSFFIGLFFVQLLVAQSEDFYDKILSYDNCRDCYFIVVGVESEPYSGRILIENDDLQDYVSKTENLDKTKYKEFVKALLMNNEKLVLRNVQSDGDFLSIKNVSEHRFRILNESDEVNKIASQGCVSFIKYYFLEGSPGVIRNSESADCKEFIKSQNKDLALTREGATFLKEQNTIIYKLFEWEIPIRMDHYSGWLTIRKADFQKKADK